MGQGRSSNPRGGQFKKGGGRESAGTHEQGAAHAAEGVARQKSVAMRAQMTALKARARTATPEERVGLKKRFDGIAGKRAAVRARADELTSARRAQTAKADPDRAGHLEQRRIARARRREAKYEKEAGETLKEIGAARARGAPQHEIDALEKKMAKQHEMSDSWSKRHEERKSAKENRLSGEGKKEPSEHKSRDPVKHEQKPEPPKPEPPRPEPPPKPEPKKREPDAEDLRRHREAMAEQKMKAVDDGAVAYYKTRDPAILNQMKQDLEQGLELHGFEKIPEQKDDSGRHVGTMVKGETRAFAHRDWSGNIVLSAAADKCLRDDGKAINFGSAASKDHASRGMCTIYHEALHGFGPTRGHTYVGVHVKVEEVTTETVARRLTADRFGYHGSRAYQNLIESMTTVIAEHKGVSWDEARGVLERTSIAFKKTAGPRMVAGQGRQVPSDIFHGLLGPGKFSSDQFFMRLKSDAVLGEGM